MTFREVQVQEVLDVQWGDTKTTKSSYVDDGYLAYSATGPDGFLSKFDYDCDGVVLSAIGANCGSTFFATNKWSCIKNTIRILPRSSDIDLKYFYFMTKSPNFWPLRGSAQPFISQTDIRELAIKIPNLATQKKIGEIIYGLELKIEKNGLIAETLEEIAQAIFKSWFIDFDPVKAKMAGEKPVGMDDATAALFPGSMEDSELGPIPSGWTVGNLGEICNIKQGKYLSPSQMVEMPEGVNTVPVIGGNGVLGYTSKSTFDFDVPLVTCRGSRCGLLQWGLFPSWVSNNAMAVTMQNSSKYSLFVYLFLKNTNFDNAITGSAQPQITITNLGYTRIVMPSTPILDAFSDLTEQMRDAVKSVNLESETLTKIREALLPRLISGELQIPEEMLVAS